MTKTILITGATDGLGKEVARRLASEGNKVLLHGRSPEKGQAVLSELVSATGNNTLEYFNADLSSLAEVKKLAADILSSQQQLEVLVNNAGIGPRTPESARSLSKDGYEIFFAVNYLAGYLLARELLPLLKSSAPARIINVASIAQAPVNFNDPMLEKYYSDGLAYSQSKLAQILHTMDLAQQLEGSGVTANSLHPATLMNTKMVLDSTALPNSRTTIDDGANAVERLILNEEMASISGHYFDCMENAEPDAQASDPQALKQLRELSEKLIAQVN
jgi:NAD(P)-dependent dehydrogenase (short-subunit alcohol dehydrogenase family)